MSGRSRDRSERDARHRDLCMLAPRSNHLSGLPQDGEGLSSCPLVHRREVAQALADSPARFLILIGGCSSPDRTCES